MWCVKSLLHLSSLKSFLLRDYHSVNGCDAQDNGKLIGLLLWSLVIFGSFVNAKMGWLRSIVMRCLFLYLSAHIT